VGLLVVPEESLEGFHMAYSVKSEFGVTFARGEYFVPLPSAAVFQDTNVNPVRVNGDEFAIWSAGSPEM
jgi:hypothetical protein